MTRGRWTIPSVLLLTTAVCDRLTKHLAAVHLVGVPPQSYLGNMVRLEYAENSGAFLSLGANLPDGLRTAVLTIGVAVLLMVVAILAIKYHWGGVPLHGVALMWAGGASNLVDRAASGHVVDFLNIGIGSLRTGIFNVADVAVMLGAILIVVGERESLRNSSSAP
jgi:signal peptidase II